MRLRGPWEYETVSAAVPRRGRVKLPDAWPSLAEHRGVPLRLRRVFHRPSGLEPHERLWLAWEGLNAGDRVCCNGKLLGNGDPLTAAKSFDITPLLAEQNELLIDLPAVGAASRPFDVWLEVRGLQYLVLKALGLELDAVDFFLQFEARVEGEPAAGPLELIVRSEDEEIIYANVSVGEDFATSAAVTSLPAGANSLEVSIRLVRGAARIWEARRHAPLA